MALGEWKQVASRGGSAPLLEKPHKIKGPQLGPVNPAKDTSCPRSWGRVQLHGPQGAPLGCVRASSPLRALRESLSGRACGGASVPP